MKVFLSVAPLPNVYSIYLSAFSLNFLLDSGFDCLTEVKYSVSTDDIDPCYSFSQDLKEIGVKLLFFL